MNFVKRLQRATIAWNKMIEAPLAHRDKMLKYWASGYFDKTNNSEQHILRLVDRGMGIIVPYLTMANPTVSVTSKPISLKPFSKTFELALQNWVENYNLVDNCLRPLIINSMFGIGVVKVGQMSEYEIEWKNNKLAISQPYIEVIDDSDYIGDVSAKRHSDFEFEGHKYRMPTKMAKEFFGGKAADHIGVDFVLHGDHSPDNITKKDITGEEFNTLKEWSEFIDIYLPDQDEIITILPDGKWDGILRRVEEKDNPFDVLGYKYLPDCPLPIPPVWSWIDMDTAINKLAVKMRNQAEREKSVLVWQAEAVDDVKRIKSASDGGDVKVDNLEMIKEIKFGGVNPENYQWVNYIESQFSIQGGNLYTMGGRNSQAETLGQEQMLMANASKMLDDMVNQVYRFIKRNLKKVAKIIWTDPIFQDSVVKNIGGVIEVEEIFDRMSKEGEFNDYDIDVKPYSMQRFNPAQRQQQILQLLSGWFLPVLPLAQQQGLELDILKASKELTEYSGLDVADFWKTAVVKEVNMGNYNPQQSNKTQSDDRMGATNASKKANLAQYQNSSRAGQPSPPNKQE